MDLLELQVAPFGEPSAVGGVEAYMRRDAISSLDGVDGRRARTDPLGLPVALVLLSVVVAGLDFLEKSDAVLNSNHRRSAGRDGFENDVDLRGASDERTSRWAWEVTSEALWRIEFRSASEERTSRCFRRADFEVLPRSGLRSAFAERTPTCFRGESCGMLRLRELRGASVDSFEVLPWIELRGTSEQQPSMCGW